MTNTASDERVKKRYLFGLVQYYRVGRCSLLMIAGRHVYERTGDTRWVCGIVFPWVVK